MTDDKKRFIIVGTGRSGSSLLAAILADAGADFAVDSRSSWERDSGAYEHPQLVKAYAWYQRADIFLTLPVPYRLVRYCMRRCSACLREALQEATFLKYPIATQMVHLIPQQGYQPKIIISYRTFETFAVSMWKRKGLSYEALVNNYVDTYKTTLLQLRLFGGCAIDYADITNPAVTNWIDALAIVTGIDAQKIADARASRVEEVRTLNADAHFWRDLMALDERPEQIYSILKTLDGTVMTPQT